MALELFERLIEASWVFSFLKFAWYYTSKPQSTCLLTLVSNRETIPSCSHKSTFNFHSRVECGNINMDIYGTHKCLFRNGFAINLSINSATLQRRPIRSHAKTFSSQKWLIYGSKFHKACAMATPLKNHKVSGATAWIAPDIINARRIRWDLPTVRTKFIEKIR